MEALLDQHPFPWASRIAQALHAALCEMYPSQRRALFVAQQAGISPAFLNADQPPFLLWADILDEGARCAQNRAVVTVARDQNPRSARRAMLDALLANTEGEIWTDSQPTSADGAPRFITSNDEITEPEALLFQDDLTLEVGRIAWMIAVLQRMQFLAPSVCRMLVRFTNGRQNGTGFRIGPNLVLTNWHVLHLDGDKAIAAQAEFGYEDDGKGGGLPTSALDGDLGTIEGDPADDWAVIRVAAPIDAAFPVLTLSDPIEPENGVLAFILQHPGGERKRLAFVRNQITFFDDRVVHYLSDTQAGSSGAPVFHESGRLIALHRGGGRPREVAGKPPLRKNEGVRIGRIAAALRQRGLLPP